MDGNGFPPHRFRIRPDATVQATTRTLLPVTTATTSLVITELGLLTCVKPGVALISDKLRSKALNVEWIAKANEVLATHHTGLVSEFELHVQFLAVEDGSSGLQVRFSGSRMKFFPGVAESADALVEIPTDLIDTAVFTGEDSAEQINEVLAHPLVAVGGDLARLGCLLDGVLRGLSPSDVNRLRAL